MIGLVTLGAGSPAVASPTGGPGDFVWLTGICCSYHPGDRFSVRREDRRDTPCRRGNARVTVHYDSPGNDARVYLMPYRPEGTDWNTFRRGHPIWRSGLLSSASAGTQHADVRVAGIGQIVSLGVLALDPATGDRWWFRNWDFMLDCGHDNGIVIELPPLYGGAPDQEQRAGQAKSDRPQ